jgi:hypothetical protein
MVKALVVGQATGGRRPLPIEGLDMTYAAYSDAHFASKAGNRENWLGLEIDFHARWQYSLKRLAQAMIVSVPNVVSMLYAPITGNALRYLRRD